MNMTTFVTSDWENSGGTDPSDGGIWDTTLNVSVTGSPVFDGDYALMCITSSDYVQEDITPSSETWMRGYVRVNSLPPAWYANDILRTVGDGTIRSGIGIYNDDTAVKWNMEYWTTSLLNANSTIANPSVNTWYCIEHYSKYNGASSTFRAWVDGVELTDIAKSVTSDISDIDKIRIGQSWSDYGHTVYVDNVVFTDDGYIGTLTTGAFSIASHMSINKARVIRTGSDDIVLRVDWDDPSDNPIGSFNVTFWVRDETPTVLGPYAGNVIKDGTGDYHGLYTLNPGDSWKINPYDAKAVISN